MNERIKQLAEQAGLVRNGDIGMKRWEGPRSDSISDQDLEKFAELIIEEACQAFWSDACNVSDLAYEEYRQNSKKIKQYFEMPI